jgi:KDO2-lipid IV(A) lauroyltransferase
MASKLRIAPTIFRNLTLSKFLQMRINSFLFRFLPFTISRWYIAFLGRLYYLIHWKERKLIQQTITYVFKRKIDSKNLQHQIKETFKGIFDHYHEKLFVAYSNFPKLLLLLNKRTSFAGVENLQQALNESKGVILVTGHFGAVEFLPGALAVKGYPASMICRFQTNHLRLSLSQRAQWVGLDLIDADEGNVILNAMKALKQGRILITECDEFDEWRSDRRRYMFFFNFRLYADRTLDLLRKRSGAPILTAFIKRKGNRIYACNLALIAHGASPVNLPVSEMCLRNLEMALEANPEQWYQWKKFGKMVQPRLEEGHGGQEIGGMVPEMVSSYADQA